MIRSLWNDEAGASMTEYAMLLALIAVAVVGALSVSGDTIASFFERIGVAVEETVPGP